jgi:GalNAc-alpha-(1->4)-GalNAc-alpha-(1->3)-diNAcBac-PP-undecaprenol alpha-1,4-N-acetyl-D-galactosaminyltransferase
MAYVLATISLNNMAGGLERNIIRLANNLAESGGNVHIMTFDFKNAESFYDIDERVIWHKVATSPPHQPIGFFDRLKLIFRMHNILKNEKAGVIVCFHHGILLRFMLASVFTRLKIIASERNSLRIYDHIQLSKWNINFFLMFLVDNITIQFKSYTADYPHLMQNKIVYIPNAVFPVDEFANPNVPNENGRYTLLSVGRLCGQKNYSTLIKAFSNLSSMHPEWDLVIVGNGEALEELSDLIIEEKLTNRVILPGATDDVSKWYNSSHLFCLPSRWEGFPNSLAEALSHGLPSVVYAGCAGAGDMVSNGENGLLAVGNGEIDSLEYALSTLMHDGVIRKRMGKASVESVKCYYPDNVFPLWKMLFNKFNKS